MQDNSVLIERLRGEMRRAGYNARSLAERAGVGRSFVYDILSGKSASPTMNKLQAVADVLGVSIPYLLNDYVSQTWEDICMIPSLAKELLPVAPPPYSFSKRWLRMQVPGDVAAMRVMMVEGDSMVPTLYDGDMVLVDISKHYPVPSGVFVLQHEMGVIVRRVDARHGGKQLYISADNPMYQGYECESREVEMLGRVVWVSRKM